MSANGGSIHVADVGKFYKRYTNRWARLVEWVDPDQSARHEKHWVLRDISFAVRAGEAIGIIGHNGAGKSTLLKIITGTTQPSSGTASINGRVAALLELGMGFHPDFTGRQNAYMSGQLLGYSSEEVSARMAEIEAFAEIGGYMDQPVRTYSSGMTVRLAFSVATCIQPDILIVDEALSVGDIYFQQKCFERIEKFADAGTTLLFVSHSMGTIINLCDRAILLKDGQLKFDGDPKSAVDLYQAELLSCIDKQPEQLIVTSEQAASNPAPSPISSDLNMAATPMKQPQALPLGPDLGSIRTQAVDFIGARMLVDEDKVASVFTVDQIATLELSYRVHAEFRDPHVGFKIRDRYGTVMYETNSYCLGSSPKRLAAAGIATFRFNFHARLAPGEYSVTVGFADQGYGEGSFERVLNYEHGVLSFQIIANIHGPRWTGLVNLDAVLESGDRQNAMDA